MKRIFLAVIMVGALTACENQGSSTVGTYEYDDDSTAVEHKLPEHSEGDVIMPDTTAKATDTLHSM